MSSNCCLRSTLTLLHGLVALLSGFFSLYTVFSSNSPLTCFPQLVDVTGNLMPFKNGMPFLCQSLVYGMGAICLLNVFMCAMNNCLFTSTCMGFLHSMMTIVFLACAVLAGTVFTVYYIVWCDVLQQAMTGSTTCDAATIKYDSLNSTALLTSHKTRMEIQLASVWTLFPLCGMAILAYTLNLREQATPHVKDDRIRYVIIQDETTPLIGTIGRNSRVVNASTTTLEQSTSPIDLTSQSPSVLPNSNQSTA